MTAHQTVPGNGSLPNYRVFEHGALRSRPRTNCTRQIVWQAALYAECDGYPHGALQRGRAGLHPAHRPLPFDLSTVPKEHSRSPRDQWAIGFHVDRV